MEVCCFLTEIKQVASLAEHKHGPTDTRLCSLTLELSFSGTKQEIPQLHNSPWKHASTSSPTCMSNFSLRRPVLTVTGKYHRAGHKWENVVCNFCAKIYFKD